MNLAPLAKQILLENEIKVDDLSKPVEVSQIGYDFLQGKLEKLNKKATKWGVPPLTMKLISQREVDVKRGGLFGKEEVIGKKKYYTISIEGDAPRVEGFTFIGKVQHTTGGENILNIAPSSPIKNLPEIYRTAKGECDVCKQNRERFNTFVLRMDKEDPERFPDKKVGDLVQVGTGCLKRFLPGVSVEALLDYAQILEDLRQYRQGGGGDDDDESWDREPSGPNPFRNHVSTDTLMKYIALVYTARGKYISKSKANYGAGESPTAEEALYLMFDRQGKMAVSKRVKENPSLASQAEVLSAKVIKWMKEQDFNQMGKDKPDMANYFGNLNVVAHSSTLDTKNAPYLGGVLQSYLYHELQKQKAATPSGEKKYIGQVGQRVTFNGLLKSQKSFPSQFTGGTVILYKFEDLDGNNIQWWSNKNLNLIDGNRYPMSGLVKKQEVDKWTNQPTTTIKNGRLEKD